MSDFDTEGAVTLVADERSLRQLRSTVEDELSDIQVGAAGGRAGGGRPAEMQADGGTSSRERRRRRREFRWNRQNNSNIEDILEAVRGLELSGGGSGGMLAEVLGIGGDFAAEGAGVAAETATGLATDIAGTTIGNAAGSIIAEEISGTSVGVETNSLSVERPEWIPIPVEDPTNGTDGPIGGPLPVPDLPPLQVPELPSIRAPESIAVDRDPLPVEDTILAVEDTVLPVENTTLPVEDKTLSVEDVGPITVAVGSRERSTQSGNSSNRGAFQRAGDALDDVGAWGADMLLPGDVPPSASERLGKGGTLSGRPFETIGRGIDTVNPTTSGGYGSGNGGGGSGGGRVDVSVTHSPTYRVDVDPRKLDRLADRIVSEIEGNVERDISELETEIDKLRSNLEQLEREITG